MRIILVFVNLLFVFNCYSQIKIDDVGDDWKVKVDSSLSLIKRIDPNKYELITQTCKHITYWNGDFSTTEDSVTIMISQKDMNFNSINNIAAILVHESRHLFYLKHKINLPPNYEEILCYHYELEFLSKIPNVESWLISNALKNIEYYGLLK
jgi:hypothetical protein